MADDKSPAAPTQALTDEELRAMGERVERATPGPWLRRVDCFDSDDGMVATIERKDGDFCFMSIADGHEQADLVASQAWPDAEFIAAARTDVPRLLSEVARLKALAGERTDRAVEEVRRIVLAETEQLRADLATLHTAAERFWEVASCERWQASEASTRLRAVLDDMETRHG